MASLMPVAKQQYFFPGTALPLVGGKLYTYAAGTSTPKNTYQDAAGTTPNTNPITLDSTGSALIYWDGSYKIVLKDALGNTIYTVDNYNTDPLGIAQFIINLAASAGSSLIGFIQSVAGAVLRTVQDKLRDTLDVRDLGILADGSDQTTALVAKLSALAGYRGTLEIPYGVKFTASTVYAALPIGIILKDSSSINSGQPPGYKNKVIRIVTNDAASDDSAYETISSHHPAYRQNNLGTAGTSSATARYHSYIRAAGIRWNNDPIDGMQLLTFKSPRGNLWRTADLVNTAYDYAVNATAKWTAVTTYTAGAKVNTDDGNVYQTTAGGTSGSTKPTGTGSGINDGGVLWNYLGPWSASRTIHYYDEDGYGGIIGTTTARLGAETTNRRGISLNTDDATGDVYVRDDQRGQDLWRLSTASGLQNGGVESLSYSGAISGATPTLSSNFHSVANGAATNMTDLLLPAGQTRAGIVYLLFTDANTTVKNTGGNFSLKGNVNVTPASGSIMGFLREPTVSSGWFEVFRNF